MTRPHRRQAWLLCGLLGLSGAAAAPTVYVENVTDSAIIALDGASGQVMGRVPIPGTPHGLISDPQRQRLFVVGGETGTVSVIDAARLRVLRTLRVGAGVRGLAVSPDGRRLYVTRAGPRTLTVFRTDTWQVERTVRLAQVPEHVLVGPGAAWLLVTSTSMAGSLPGARLSGSVTLLDGSTLKVRNTWMLGGRPYRAALSPDGRRAALTELDGERIDLLNTAPFAVAASYPVGMVPEQLAFRTGQELWVSNLSGTAVTVLDVSSGNSVNVGTGDGPYGLGISADGRDVFVSNMREGTVVRIDALTRRVTARYRLGGELHALVVGR
ncbi:40-residue YVTN family beta-propeller repeat protein [Deinococcus aerius]|uniref:40-residue YVTN family beta-propeller repeat protein n=2 Tax=Deinococcus TaxID=1298 RepID=A0A2I9CS50_9DEIO|nr:MULTISPECIES: hypothetical protein [Deinococcus]MBB5293708.1 DNA-binding beta-propeller fold protein YncE [Deinococcus metallilatus]QBY07324.1 hypothetical protein E5F05_04930 [Deinococcus metallilatus]RXJ14797.1 hypothetical protein ERJ73_03650 [Deinococcus metallilatus]TLK30918.1 hypothetical protein FCS05_03965 [Deinococcus metallilatus]GBF04414.1 40-residue YVTN family beta-propeller repeat protein [Deinococcus aerius]